MPEEKELCNGAVVVWSMWFGNRGAATKGRAWVGRKTKRGEALRSDAWWPKRT